MIINTANYVKYNYFCDYVVGIDNATRSPSVTEGSVLQSRMRSQAVAIKACKAIKSMQDCSISSVLAMEILQS